MALIVTLSGSTLVHRCPSSCLYLFGQCRSYMARASIVNDQSRESASSGHSKFELRAPLSIERNQPVISPRRDDPATPRQPPLVLNGPFDIHAPSLRMVIIDSRELVVTSRTRVTLEWFWLLVDGFYIWEFLITLGFEWNVIRGRRPHRWTIWIYSLTRLLTLAAVAVNIHSLVAPIPFICQTTIGLQFILCYPVIAASSLLIVLRVIAIWEKNRTIVAIVTAIWGTNVVFLIQGATRFRASWDSEISDCVLNVDGIRLSTICAFVTDITLLLIMLFGLHRLRRHSGLMALGRLLWNQGVAWLSVAAVAELLPTVFICLDVNVSFQVLFQIPWMITISIAATRMYRSLSDFLSPDVRNALETNGTPTAPIFLTGVQVDVHKAHEQPPTPQGVHFGTDIAAQSHVKPHELTMDLAGDHDIESGSEN